MTGTLDNSRSVRKQYRDPSNLAARVDMHARFSTSPVPWPEWVASKLELDGCSRVLEVGCGPGYLWRTREQPIPGNLRVVMTDLSAGMVSEARTQLDDDRFDFATADVQSLPFDDASFELVIANHMLYHVPSLELALGEFVRVLRPGGRLFAATNGPAHFREVREILGIQWRYVDMFNLDNAPHRLSPFFADVAVERHADSLAVPETEPVIQYMRSMSSFWTLDAVGEATLRRVVDESIARDGVYRISKDTGAVIARRR